MSMSLWDFILGAVAVGIPFGFISVVGAWYAMPFFKEWRECRFFRKYANKTNGML